MESGEWRVELSNVHLHISPVCLETCRLVKCEGRAVEFPHIQFNAVQPFFFRVVFDIFYHLGGDALPAPPLIYTELVDVEEIPLLLDAGIIQKPAGFAVTDTPSEHTSTSSPPLAFTITVTVPSTMSLT